MNTINNCNEFANIPVSLDFNQMRMIINNTECWYYTENLALGVKKLTDERFTQLFNNIRINGEFHTLYKDTVEMCNGVFIPKGFDDYKCIINKDDTILFVAKNNFGDITCIIVSNILKFFVKALQTVESKLKDTESTCSKDVISISCKNLESTTTNFKGTRHTIFKDVILKSIEDKMKNQGMALFEKPIKGVSTNTYIGIYNGINGLNVITIHNDGTQELVRLDYSFYMDDLRLMFDELNKYI